MVGTTKNEFLVNDNVTIIPFYFEWIGSFTFWVMSYILFLSHRIVTIEGGNCDKLFISNTVLNPDIIEAIFVPTHPH